MRSSQQSLNKRSLHGGVGDLKYDQRESPYYTSTHGGDARLCHCNCKAPQSIHKVTYHQFDDHEMVLCMCPNVVMSATYMIEMMGCVPMPFDDTIKQ
ncbi:unnamed protein product [Adineta ricciae]|nr:unnamed protein product [Adineta ricciae]